MFSINGHKKLTSLQEIELCKRMKDGDTEARDQLYGSCVPWAVHLSEKIARQRYGSGINDARLDDVVQAGLLGLLEAVNRFDPLRSKLTTYSYWWIRKECHDFISKDRTIRLPRYIYAHCKKDLKSIGILPLVSLDEYNNDGLNYVTSSKALQYEDEGLEAVDIADEACNVKESMKTCLTQRQINILEQRLSGKTLAEIGEILGLCRERVRQIQNKALKRLRMELHQ